MKKDFVPISCLSVRKIVIQSTDHSRVKQIDDGISSSCHPEQREGSEYTNKRFSDSSLRSD